MVVTAAMRMVQYVPNLKPSNYLNYSHSMSDVLLHTFVLSYQRNTQTEWEYK